MRQLPAFYYWMNTRAYAGRFWSNKKNWHAPQNSLQTSGVATSPNYEAFSEVWKEADEFLSASTEFRVFVIVPQPPDVAVQKLLDGVKWLMVRSVPDLPFSKDDGVIVLTAAKSLLVGGRTKPLADTALWQAIMAALEAGSPSREGEQFALELSLKLIPGNAVHNLSTSDPGRSLGELERDVATAQDQAGRFDRLNSIFKRCSPSALDNLHSDADAKKEAALHCQAWIYTAFKLATNSENIAFHTNTADKETDRLDVVRSLGRQWWFDPRDALTADGVTQCGRCSLLTILGGAISHHRSRCTAAHERKGYSTFAPWMMEQLRCLVEPRYSGPSSGLTQCPNLKPTPPPSPDQLAKIAYAVTSQHPTLGFLWALRACAALKPFQSTPDDLQTALDHFAAHDPLASAQFSTIKNLVKEQERKTLYEWCDKNRLAWALQVEDWFRSAVPPDARFQRTNLYDYEATNDSEFTKELKEKFQECGPGCGVVTAEDRSIQTVVHREKSAPADARTAQTQPLLFLPLGVVYELPPEHEKAVQPTDNNSDKKPDDQNDSNGQADPGTKTVGVDNKPPKSDSAASTGSPSQQQTKSDAVGGGKSDGSSNSQNGTSADSSRAAGADAPDARWKRVAGSGLWMVQSRGGLWSNLEPTGTWRSLAGQGAWTRVATSGLWTAARAPSGWILSPKLSSWNLVPDGSAWGIVDSLLSWHNVPNGAWREITRATGWQGFIQGGSWGELAPMRSWREITLPWGGRASLHGQWSVAGLRQGQWIEAPRADWLVAPQTGSWSMVGAAVPPGSRDYAAIAREPAPPIKPVEWKPTIQYWTFDSEKMRCFVAYVVPPKPAEGERPRDDGFLYLTFPAVKSPSSWDYLTELKSSSTQPLGAGTIAGLTVFRLPIALISTGFGDGFQVEVCESKPAP
ncbi:MAG: hypothetical protein IPK82_20080 [Polyangiaceae bacterium]|nr:hypothetical protein [Polyangiaceae bacterium]